MKRQKSKTRKANKEKRSRSEANSVARPAASVRHRLVGFVRGWGLVVAAVGAIGWYVVDSIASMARESDLSKIGNGVPAIVQIHDPECVRCRALQNESRDAMAAFDDDELQFLVANIRQAEGRQLAAAHGVGHVTLLLFDGDGKRRGTLVGERLSESLESAFRQHLAKYGARKDADGG